MLLYTAGALAIALDLVSRMPRRCIRARSRRYITPGQLGFLFLFATNVTSQIRDVKVALLAPTLRARLAVLLGQIWWSVVTIVTARAGVISIPRRLGIGVLQLPRLNLNVDKHVNHLRNSHGTEIQPARSHRTILEAIRVLVKLNAELPKPGWATFLVVLTPPVAVQRRLLHKVTLTTKSNAVRMCDTQTVTSRKARSRGMWRRCELDN
jgi:hypothetical protein